MQEIFNENPDDEKIEPEIETPAEMPQASAENTEAARKTRTWRQWIETDEAMRKIYLGFGFFCHFDFNNLDSIFHRRDLLRRLGRLLSHSLERGFVGKFQPIQRFAVV